MEILDKADIGVFGGSGFYSFLKDIEEIKVDTPYGKTSDSVFLGKIGEHKVAFMPRHMAETIQFPSFGKFQSKCLGNETFRLQRGNFSLRCR